MKRACWILAAILVVCLEVLGQRLPPAGVTPENYRLKFTPDLATATFTGDETIRVKLDKAAASIVVNAAELQFQKVTITAKGKTQTATVTSDERNEQATFTFPTPVPAGIADIQVHYTGILNDQLRGFYLSQTKRRRYAVTQFEATDARRAFPSFDEPAFKATYDITLIVDKDDTGISNGSIVSDSPGPVVGKHTLVFSTTPRMSTYLVAMMVGDFQCVSGAADNIPIRVCSVPENKPYINYAVSAAENIMKFYNRYYTIKYPFKKLDIIAFPDFSAGAMENTAAITYREEYLLINEQTASVDQRKLVVDVLAHEMAHQWFGDLVTMKWWNDIWLNEGFATWMSNKPTEAWKPEWNAAMDEIEGTGEALETDRIATIRAIRADAETPAEIGALFDGIAYGKTAAVLRMIESYVGSESFRDGVNLYLSKHAYGNATAQDFWNAETTATRKPIDQILPTFINQSGAPLITLRAQCDQDHTNVTLSQQRYFADREKLEAGSPEKWQVPVCLKAPGEKGAACQLLTEKQQTFQLKGCEPWVLGNATGRGYYHVGYDAEALQKIAAAAETALTPEERISFLNDSWALVAVGRLSIADYLNVVSAMRTDRTRAVVESMLSRIRQIHSSVVSSESKPAFEAWVRQLLRPMVQELGMNAQSGDSDERRQLRSAVLNTLGSAGNDPDVISSVHKLAEAYMKDPASVDPTIVANAMALAASNGDAALYDRFLERMKSARTPDEFYVYLKSLDDFSDPRLVEKTAQLYLSPEIRSQDLFLILGLIGNPDTQEAAWRFFKTHFKEFEEKSGAALGTGMVSVAGAFCNAQLLDDATKFLAGQNIPGSQRELTNAVERANACIDLKSLQQSNLDSFLKSQQK